MSATINCREFAEYFATPVYGKMSPAYVFEVEGAPYSVEEFYLDDLHQLLPCRVKKWPNVFFMQFSVLLRLCLDQVESPHPDDPYISPEMYNLAMSLIQSFDEMESKNFRWGWIALLLSSA